MKETEEVSGKKAGTVMTVAFEIAGQEFLGLNGGPLFHITPAISFTVSCDSEKEVDDLWKALSKDGKVLMELQEYPFSKKYGWVQDRFGVSWQLNLAPSEHKIRPSFLFVGEQHGKAEEAMKFYVSLFKDSKILQTERYNPGESVPKDDGKLKFARFSLAGQEFITMDSGIDHKFGFTEGVSLIVNCEDQKEIDTFWEKMSAHPESEQCGWMKDTFGISWQITPIGIEEWVKHPKGMEAMLEMKKLDIAALKKAAQS